MEFAGGFAFVVLGAVLIILIIAPDFTETLSGFLNRPIKTAWTRKTKAIVGITGLVFLLLGLEISLGTPFTKSVTQGSDIANSQTPISPSRTPTTITQATIPIVEGESLVSISGELIHNPNNQYAESNSLGEKVSDFILEGDFVNPYSADDQLWDIGVNFRISSSYGYYRLVITSNGDWSYHYNKDDRWHDVDQGKVTNLNPGNGERNHIKIVALEQEGCLYINETFVSELDLSELTHVGDIALVVGIKMGAEREGAATSYENFTVARPMELNCS